MAQPLPGTNAVPSYFRPSTEKSSSGVAEGEGLVQALDRPPAERPAFLDSACAGDTALRREVERLLAADAQRAGFLAGTPGELAQQDEAWMAHALSSAGAEAWPFWSFHVSTDRMSGTIRFSATVRIASVRGRWKHRGPQAPCRVAFLRSDPHGPEAYY